MSDQPDSQPEKKHQLSDRRTVASKFQKPEDTDEPPAQPPRPAPYPHMPGPGHGEGFSIGNTQPKRRPDASAEQEPAIKRKEPTAPKHGRDLLRDTSSQAAPIGPAPSTNILEGDSAWDRGRPLLIGGILLLLIAALVIYLVTNRDWSKQVATDESTQSNSLNSRPTASRAATTTNPAVALIEDNTAALGGYELLKKLSSIRIRGEVESAGKVIPFSLYGRRPNDYRLVFEISGRDELIIGFNGQTAWSQVKRDGQNVSIRPFSEAELPQLIQHADFDLAPQKYLLVGEYSKDRQATVMQAKSMSPELLDGEMYDVYRIEESGRPTIICYQDMSSNLLRQTETKIGNDRYREVYEDYRKVEGVYFPFLQTSYVNGKLESVSRIKQVQYNTGLIMSLFDPPEEITAEVE
ncbi:hypothetical protein [Cerasicoccus fimbriatus]|uniref:hypothetical protein n=1 Tax=Cerasicoccus fimbriatus TaxID=3014554 RepID=UPI0022B3F9CD|nr:hypothetical protein [Cerasicoccus sp. TK19100]